MWEKLTSLFISTILPASIVTTQVVNPVTAPDLDIDIDVHPLAVVANENVQDPEVLASAALVIETHSNEALFTHNVWEPLPIASLTKLMTALVVVENLSLDKEVVISANASKTIGSRMGLYSGEKILVRDLLKGLLMSSGNDAAVALSEATSGSTQEFVTLMNQRTERLGLTDTFFVDPAGLDAGNVSSAFEIAHLAKQVFKDPFLSSIMREKSLDVYSTDKVYHHVLTNTDRLLGTDIADRIIAGKTGTTAQAGQCLISFLNGSSDRTLLIIILGSQQRYDEMKKLIDWVDNSFVWE